MMASLQALLPPVAVYGVRRGLSPSFQGGLYVSEQPFKISHIKLRAGTQRPTNLPHLCRPPSAGRSVGI